MPFIPQTVRNMALAVLLGGTLAAGAFIATAPAMAQACDPSYPDVCLPAYPDVSCVNIGFPIRVIHDAGMGAFDPHFLDTDFNGIGCELG